MLETSSLMSGRGCVTCVRRCDSLQPASFYLLTAPSCSAAYLPRSITTRIDETDSRGYRLLGTLHRVQSRLNCLYGDAAHRIGCSSIFFGVLEPCSRKGVGVWKCLSCWKLWMLLRELSNTTYRHPKHLLVL
jgi:hypothetical protein